MPRPPRLEYEDALYHVTSRGNARETLFYSDDDRNRFILQLQDNLERYGVILYAWVLMTNHFHLVLRTPRGNLSRFMQRLNSSYCLYFRYKHGTPGHVLGGRYKARLIESEEYLLTVTRYVHLNPIRTAKHKEMTGKQRMACLETYPWSSYPSYVRAKRCPEWLSDRVLQLYGKTLPAARRRYRTYMHAGVLETDEATLQLLNFNAYAIGSDSFIKQTEEQLSERSNGSPSDADVALPCQKNSFAEIDRVVCEEYGVGAEDLQMHGLASGISKIVAVELAVRHSGETMRSIGQHYGGITSQAIAMTHRRAQVLDGIDWSSLECSLNGCRRAKK